LAVRACWRAVCEWLEVSASKEADGDLGITSVGGTDQGGGGKGGGAVEGWNGRWAL